jgi:hypothetical protein
MDEPRQREQGGGDRERVDDPARPALALTG